jgi:hypothetical protein
MDARSSRYWTKAKIILFSVIKSFQKVCLNHVFFCQGALKNKGQGLCPGFGRRGEQATDGCSTRKSQDELLLLPLQSSTARWGPSSYTEAKMFQKKFTN